MPTQNQPNPGIKMVATEMVIVPRHPVVNAELGVVSGWKAGKVWPGDSFIWRGALHEAPVASRCVNPKDQVRVDAARAEFAEQQANRKLQKQAQGAALAAAAAAQAIGKLPQLEQGVEPEQRPRRAPRTPRAKKGAGRLQAEAETSNTGAREPAVAS